MASLQNLRNRLAKLSQQQQDQPTSELENTWPSTRDERTSDNIFTASQGLQSGADTTGGLLSNENQLDLTMERGWLQQIQQGDNRAEDWLAFLDHLSSSTFTSDMNKFTIMLHYFNKALKSVSEESTKHEAYGHLQVKFAQLKGQHSVEDGQRAFSNARSTARRFAFVHVAAAQFEMDQGNQQKARQILLKAKDRGAEPRDMINLAIRNLISGKSQLVSEQERMSFENKSSSNKENQAELSVPSTELLQPRRSWMDRPVCSSTSSSVFTTPAPTHTTNSLTQGCGSGSGSSRTRDLAVYTDLLKPPQGKSGSTSGEDTAECTPGISAKPTLDSAEKSEEGDYIQYGYITDRSSRKVQRVPLTSILSSASNTEALSTQEAPEAMVQPTPRTLRSCHSTPDCKKPGVLSSSLFNKPKRMTGKPLRVLKRTGLPELQEGADPGTDEESLHMMPLPDALTSVREGIAMETAADTSQAVSHDISDGRPEEQQAAEEERNHTGEVRQTDSNGDSGVIMHHTGEPPAQAVPSQGQVQDAMPVRQPAPVSTAPLPAPVLPPPVPTPAPQNMLVPAPSQAVVPMPAQMPPMHPMMGFMCTPMGKNAQMLTVNNKSYVVFRMIGRGGSSKVYETWSYEDNSMRAIKCVNLDSADETTIESYRNEIELLKKLQYSDRVIRMFDFEYQESEAMLYVVMERGDTDLMSYFRNCKKQGQLHPLKIKFYWMEMLHAVQVLHKEGIVHSDLKPANFLLVEGTLKLIDFGIANAIQQDMTSMMREQQIGTLNYMSPEAIVDVGGSEEIDEAGRPKPRFKIGVKSDVWSLGCILYNMVYNRTPFQKVANQLKLQAIINPHYKIEFPPLEDTQLLDVLQKCLQRDPKLRPSIEELLNHPYLQKM